MENIEKSCLLIIDIQKGFINKHTKHILPKINHLLDQFDIIFATKFYNIEGSFYDTLINWHELRKNTEEFELAFTTDKNLNIIEKSVYTCVNSDFIKKLKHDNIKKVYICGIDTDICVTKSAVDLFENGIIPIIIENYCASTGGKQAHNNGISTLKRYIGSNQIIKL